MTDIRERIEARVYMDPTCGCWLWPGAFDGRKGYGAIGVNGRGRRLHRVAYEAYIGPIPNGMHVLHRCDTPSCANPDHLFIGTNADNVADRIAKGREGDRRGERNGRAKLTLEQARAIAGDRRKRAIIAAEYGVSIVTVNRIRGRRAWKEAFDDPLPGEPPKAFETIKALLRVR